MGFFPKIKQTPAQCFILANTGRRTCTKLETRQAMLKGSFSLCMMGSWKASQAVKAMGFSTGRQDRTIILLTIQTITCISALVFLQQKIRLD